MSMRLKKVCPQCSAVLHARKLACQCGYVFPAKAEQNERKRPIETRQTDSVRKAAKRACATHEETLKRHAQNKQHMASLRQCETHGRPAIDKHKAKSTWQALDSVKHVKID